MKLNTLFIINGIVALLFGLGFVLAPAMVLSPYGVVLDEAGLYIARLLGAAYLSFAILSWLVRNSTGSSEIRSVTLSFCVGNMLGFLISLTDQLLRPVNPLGWSTVVVFLFLGAGFGYFYFKKP